MDEGFKGNSVIVNNGVIEVTADNEDACAIQAKKNIFAGACAG